jgi:FKBP-type peptidyl-prolyl cis-trans isomerase FklB
MSITKFGMTVGLVLALVAGWPALAAAPAASLGSDKEKFSYTVGFQIGQSLMEDGLDIDVNALSQAIRDVVSGTPPRLSMDEMQTAVQSFQMQQMEAREADAKDNLRTGQAFLADNRTKPGVVETESGLQYQVVEDGGGKQPAETDTVVVNYRGTLIDGTEFDSSFRRGEPVTFPVNAVIPGWQEALKLMKVGAKWKVFIPADLAYGERGAGQNIGPNETLVFDIELIGIE